MRNVGPIAGGGSTTLAGDVTGAAGANTVAKIAGNAVGGAGALAALGADASGAAAAAQAASQPLNSTLTTIGGAGKVSVALGGTNATDAATARSNLGLAPGTDIAALPVIDWPASTAGSLKSHGANGSTPQFTLDTEFAVSGDNPHTRLKSAGAAILSILNGSAVTISGASVVLQIDGWTALRTYGNNAVFLGGPSNVWSQTWSQLYNTVKGGNLASAATITPTAGIHHVTGTTDIATITPPANFSAGSITLIPDGLWHTITGGNIALGSTAVVGKALIMTWDGTSWYPSY